MTLTETADKLGRLKAKMADLRAEEAKLKKRLVDSGYDEVEGDSYRVVVTRCEVTRVDWKGVAKKLEPSHQLVSAYTSHADSVRVCVNAR